MEMDPPPGAKTKGHDLLVWPLEDPPTPRGTRNTGSEFSLPLVHVIIYLKPTGAHRGTFLSIIIEI